VEEAEKEEEEEVESKDGQFNDVAMGKRRGGIRAKSHEPRYSVYSLY
jgi:hypothetical protein